MEIDSYQRIQNDLSMEIGNFSTIYYMKCAICPNQVKSKYNATCSKKCGYQYRKIFFQKKYGIDNPFQLQEVKDKIKKTIIEKYGVENVSQSNKIKQKKIKTCLKNFGVEHPGQSLEIKEKIKKVCLEKYGVENPMFVEEIKNRSIKNGGGRATPIIYETIFGNKIIIQGSYEFNFVKECELKNIFITNGPCVDYIYNDVNRKYYIDFLIIESEKIIKLIEIKSTYYFEKYKNEILCKKTFAENYAKDHNMIYELKIFDKTRKERKELLNNLNKN